MNSSEIKKIIKTGAELEIRKIDWLGGDPLLRPDWPNLMNYANEMGLINNVWTSGLPLQDLKTAEKVVELTKGGFISFHLDSIDETVYQKLHPNQKKDYINRILSGVDNLFKLGKSAENIINCVTYTEVQATADIKKTIEILWQEKGIRTCLVLFKPEGFGQKFYKLEPSFNQIKEAYIHRNRLNYQDSKVQLGTQDVTKYYCGTMICVTFTGDITPCSVIRKGVGNIKQNDFKVILFKNKHRLIMEEMHEIDNLPGYCKECENNQICWGCRANSWNKLGDWMAEDPKCWFNPNNS